MMTDNKIITNKLKKKIVRDDGTNTCFTDCIAFYLCLNPKRVPFFIEHQDWVARVKKYFRKKGFTIEPVKYKPSLLSNPKEFYLVQGLSPRSKAKDPSKTRFNQLEHCVVYRGKKPYFDPSPSGKFLRGKPRFVWLIKRV